MVSTWDRGVNPVPSTIMPTVPPPSPANDISARSVIETCAEYGIKTGRIEGLTGVWVDFEKPEDPKADWNPRKICALGVKTSRWVTMHGLAFNVNTLLSYFNNIVPCGIDDKAVTSLSKETGRELDIKEVESKLQSHIASIFEMAII